MSGYKVYIGHLVLGRPGYDSNLVLLHVSGNTRDNRKQNLAWVTRAVLTHRSDKPKRSKYNIRYRGVTFEVKSRRYRASISLDGRKKYLGVFDNETEAARAYDAAAVLAFGRFARLNFPPGALKEIGLKGGKKPAKP